MQRHRVAIIGLGVMGRRMLANMAAHPRFAFSGVWDPDPAAGRKVADEFPDIPVAPGPEALIASSDTDLVYVACPPAWHKGYVLAAAAAGKPVFCEKPLGIDVAESRALVAELTQRGTRCIVNFIQSTSHAVELTRQRLDSGDMGAIAGGDIVVHFSKWPRDWQADADWLRFRAQGGFSREVLSHFVFLAGRFLGSPRLIAARPRYQADPTLSETHQQAMLDCAGVPVAVFGSTGGAGPDRVEFTLWGTKRSHRLHDWFWLQSSDGGEWVKELADIEDLRAANFRRLLDDVAAFADGKTHVLPTAADALAVQELIEAMLRA
ncbi:MAG: Gfo/Idh/MocA family oxidoreductase [Rhodospirillales bacterium]|nr:Gfo/Idh/MocA family oxidoreductase [Rhodospirillales bacterium]